MRRMKYVTVKGPLHREIYIFMESIQHDVFASRMGFKHEDLVGAGFVNFNNMTCYGQSISLGVKSHTNDTILLRQSVGYEE